MRINRIIPVGLLGVLALAGCKTNDDLLADKDRRLGASENQVAALQKRLADQESIRLVMQKDLDAKQEEIANKDARIRELQDEIEELQRTIADGTEPDVPDPGPRRVAEGVDVINRDGAVVIRLDNAVTFSSGSASLSKNGQSLLEREVAELIASYPEHRLSIEGHTDDVPVKKSRWKNNLNLSIARALEVRRFLASNAKVAPDRMRIAAYGEHVPRVAAKTKAARAKNRRVEIVLYRPAADN